LCCGRALTACAPTAPRNHRSAVAAEAIGTTAPAATAAAAATAAVVAVEAVVASELPRPPPGAYERARQQALQEPHTQASRQLVPRAGAPKQLPGAPCAARGPVSRPVPHRSAFPMRQCVAVPWPFLGPTFLLLCATFPPPNPLPIRARSALALGHCIPHLQQATRELATGVALPRLHLSAFAQPPVQAHLKAHLPLRLTVRKSQKALFRPARTAHAQLGLHGLGH
jgi:hypothetical protein